MQDSSATERPFISVEGLTKTFGQLVALDAVDFGIAAGEVHALLGENGAGKTTLCNILAGIYRADSGEVYLDGSSVSFHSPADAIAGGIGMVHQHFKLVPTMTVAQNLHMGWQETPRVFTNAELNQRSAAIIEEFKLPVDPTAKIFELSVGEQQRVEIVRTLARGAKLLILDEPTAVLTSQEATELFDVLRELVATGRSVIFISHKLREVLAVADRITVLRNGKRMTTIDVAAATVDKLAQLMTGSDQPIGQVARSSTVDAGKVILEATGVEALSSRGLVALKGVDLTVRSGEIVGVAGVSGNGQTELAELIVGVRPLTAGSIKIADDDGGMSSPRPGQSGIGSIPEDRMGHGLVGAASTLRNAVTREYRTRELSDGLWLKWAGIRDYAARVVREGRVQVRDMAASVGQLSGGNQQRLLAKREALVADRFLLAVHPTRGLDIQAALEVQQTLEERRAAGAGVLLISDDLGEVLAMSDRIVVMYDGEIVGESERGQFDRDKIGLQMGGHFEAAAAS